MVNINCLNVFKTDQFQVKCDLKNLQYLHIYAYFFNFELKAPI